MKSNGTCRALLWIHTRYQTGEPLQIDANEWYGRVDVLGQLTDDTKIGELDLTGLTYEEWICVRIEYHWEERDYSIQLFQDCPTPRAKMGEPPTPAK